MVDPVVPSGMVDPMVCPTVGGDRSGRGSAGGGVATGGCWCCLPCLNRYNRRICNLSGSWNAPAEVINYGLSWCLCVDRDVFPQELPVT